MLLTKLWKIISNPDWWIVLLTAINTTAVVFIAIVQIRIQKQQTKLYEQQNKQQEYEIYKQMYISIQRMNDIIDGFLYVLYITILKSDSVEDIKDELDDIRGRILKTDQLLSQDLVDFELKLEQGEIIVKEYRGMVRQIVSLIAYIRSIAHKDNGIKKEYTEIDNEYTPENMNDILLRSAIVARISEDKDAKRLDRFINRFVENKDILFEKDYVAMIKNKM